MVRPGDPAPKHRPEALHAIGVRHIAHKLNETLVAWTNNAVEGAMQHLVFAMLLFESDTVYACDKNYVPILEAHGFLEEQIEAIGTKHPIILTIIAVSNSTAQHISSLGVTSASEYENCQHEVNKAMSDWGKQMAGIWTGPWSEDDQIMSKMFDRALQNCRATCH